MAGPVNSTQQEFNQLCKLGGGFKGGPAKGKVLELLRSSGRSLNMHGYQVMDEHLNAYPDANPWHVCFAVSLSWGHLSKLDVEFTGHVVSLLANWNATDLGDACSFHLERGPEPIERSLVGAHNLFGKIKFPEKLCTTLGQLNDAQQRWLGPILNPSTRPPYIGSWNATAMFMTALFAQPNLAAQQRTPQPMLPPGGPIWAGLSMLHKAGIISSGPADSQLDDQAFEPGALYENNHLLVDIVNGRSDWCLIDVHSGVYMLGTRDPNSAKWI